MKKTYTAECTDFRGSPPYRISGILGSGGGSVFLSTNNGASWTAASMGLPTAIRTHRDMGAILRFGGDIVEASPTVGPILYALLRNAVSYGYYLVVRDNQYWPFKSEMPLTTESFKLGLTLTL